MAITTTPRFGMKKYGAGTDPHPTRTEHNALIDLVETQAARYSSGTTAARPLAGKDGTFYRDRDAGRVYLDDGTNWVDIATNGGGGPGAAVVVAGAAIEGTSTRSARADHTHSLALATTAAHGGMSSGDKSKLDASTAAATPSTLAYRDASGRIAVGTPAAAGDAATKAYVDTAVGGRALSSHTHAAADITSGTLAAARLPLATTATAGALSPADKTRLDGATSTATAGALAVRDGAGRLAVSDPDAVGDASTKGYVDQQVNTRAPATHTHLWADITDKPAVFAPDVHTHGWADITGKPTTFAPSAHNHSGAEITSGTIAVARLPFATPTASGIMPYQDKALLDGREVGAWANTLVVRDSGGRFDTQRPLSANQVANKDYVDDVGLARVTWTEFDKRITRGAGHTHIKSPDGGTVFALNDSGTIGSTNIYNTNAATGSSWRALWVNNSGVLGYNLSSRKFKTAERDYEVPLDVLDSVTPKWFKYIKDVDELGLDAAPERFNFMAEDLHDAGLTEYVSYEGDTGAREDAQTINEQLLVNALWSICRQLRDRIDHLEAR
ncbi:tailspike protein [Arthrobacter phage Lilmac1015]|uniref:Tailspike protein n=1 Tax=Arthrobacter phage Lilmac1015 TaxID=2912653 RepID=A0AA49BPL2_9CAUD|nr:tailspike protein [Arthrobacter phage Lilmac1015]